MKEKEILSVAITFYKSSIQAVIWPINQSKHFLCKNERLVHVTHGKMDKIPHKESYLVPFVDEMALERQIWKEEKT